MSGRTLDDFDLMVVRDHWLPQVSTERVADACRQIGLDLVGDKSWVDIATEVRRGLAATIKNRFEGPNRLAPSKLRDELKNLADVVNSASKELHQLSLEADAFLFRHSLRDWGFDNESDTEVTLGMPVHFTRLKCAVPEIAWLSSFLQSAAETVEVPQGPWKSAESKELRIARGTVLAPIFEASFGLQATANNYPSDSRHKEETPFMKFYQQMVALAFNEQATPDLSGVLKEACSLHKARGA